MNGRKWRDSFYLSEMSMFECHFSAVYRIQTSNHTVSSYKSDRNEIETVLTNLLIGRTRAMLFSTIENLLKNKYGDKIPVIYGMPIVNMDVKHSKKFKKVISV